MSRLANSANRQYQDLIDHYLDLGRGRAAELLQQALDQARRETDQNPETGDDFPAMYRNLRWPNVKWVKIHRYRFSYTIIIADDGEPVIFNIIWKTANMPARAVPPHNTA